MSDDLLGYLLGVLDDSEHAQMERELAADPRLQKRRDALQAYLAPLEEERRWDEPPAGLADRTCRYVTECVASASSAALASPARSGLSAEMSPGGAGADRRRSWNWWDVAAAAAVCAAAAILFFPAVLNSRYNSRLAQCQDNLRHLGVALTQYASSQPDGTFPAIAQSGNRAAAGIYAPQVYHAGLVDDARRFLCPSVAGKDRDSWRVPPLEAIDSAFDGQLAQLHREMGGDFAYNLGYFENDRYHTPRYLGRSRYAILADAPSDARQLSANHGDHGQNTLFEDGHVRFVVGQGVEQLGDEIYLNDRGRPEAGLHRDDAVLGASSASPMAVRNVSR